MVRCQMSDISGQWAVLGVSGRQERKEDLPYTISHFSFVIEVQDGGLRSRLNAFSWEG